MHPILPEPFQTWSHHTDEPLKRHYLGQFTVYSYEGDLYVKVTDGITFYKLHALGNNILINDVDANPSLDEPGIVISPREEANLES